MVPRPNVPSDVHMQMQPVPVPASAETPPLPADCLSQQPCQAKGQRGPHDFAASWKVGTTDRSLLAAVGAQPQSNNPSQQKSENGNGAANQGAQAQ